jgi:hypothetical protein
MTENVDNMLGFYDALGTVLDNTQKYTMSNIQAKIKGINYCAEHLDNLIGTQLMDIVVPLPEGDVKPFIEQRYGKPVSAELYKSGIFSIKEMEEQSNNLQNILVKMREEVNELGIALMNIEREASALVIGQNYQYQIDFSEKHPDIEINPDNFKNFQESLEEQRSDYIE